MKRIIGSQTILAAVCVTAVVASGAGYALASGSGSITACVKKNGGTLYKANKCHHGDKKLTWSKQGPKGATGATGPAGTVRAWALVESDGAISRSSGVASVDNVSTGDYCVELNSSINNSTTAAVATPNYGSDTTIGDGNFVHTEYDGTCGTNGEEILTFEVTSNGSAYSSDTFHDEGFMVIVP